MDAYTQKPPGSAEFPFVTAEFRWHVDTRSSATLCLPSFILPSAIRCPVMPPAESAHSAVNIAKWRTYLPADCVNTMIRMGWDIST